MTDVEAILSQQLRVYAEYVADVIACLPEALTTGETVIDSAIAATDAPPDLDDKQLVVLTDQRLLAIHCAASDGTRYHVHEHVFSSIRTVVAEQREVTGTLTVQTVDGTMTFAKVQPTDRASELAARIQTMIGTDLVVPVLTPTDIPEQLRQLGELRDAGVLTNEEFTAKKTDLLARL